jgi:cytochrome c biogenesis protein CcmG/thiol:disulfide interchange protein DsbE
LNRRVLLAGLVVVLPLLAVLLTNLGRDPHLIRSPLVGRDAPRFALVPVGGGAPLSLESLRGKPVVVNFWATWCMPCLEEHAALVAGARRYSPAVQFLGIVYEDEEGKVASFLRQRGTAYPSLMDEGGRTAIAYGVGGVPETYFIDAAGKVVSKWNGPLTADALASLVQQAGGPS